MKHHSSALTCNWISIDTKLQGKYIFIKLFFFKSLFVLIFFIFTFYILLMDFYYSTQNFNECLLEHFLYNSFLNFIFHFHFNSSKLFSHSRDIYFKFFLFFYSYKSVINFKLKFTILILTSIIPLKNCGGNLFHYMPHILLFLLFIYFYFYPKLSLLFKTLLLLVLFFTRGGSQFVFNKLLGKSV